MFQLDNHNKVVSGRIAEAHPQVRRYQHKSILADSYQRAVCHQRHRAFAVGSVVMEIAACSNITISSPPVGKPGAIEDIGFPVVSKLVK
jgi:hypothetical protein